MRKRHRRWKVANKRKFILFVCVLIVVLVVIAQFTTSSQSNQPYASASSEGVMPESKTIYVAPPYTEAEVEMLAKTVYGEALVTGSKTEMSAVIWCILNRVDTDGYACGKSIEYVITYPGQFSGYRKSNPVTPEIDALVRDVLERWYNEKNGAEDVGRTLPKEYLFFVGDGYTNYYTTEWKSTSYWDWSLASPYES